MSKLSQQVRTYAASKPTEYLTKDYGVCVQQHAAERVIINNGGWPRYDPNDGLVFQYPGEPERKVLPIFLNGAGWLYVMRELERGTNANNE